MSDNEEIDRDAVLKAVRRHLRGAIAPASRKALDELPDAVIRIGEDGRPEIGFDLDFIILKGMMQAAGDWIALMPEERRGDLVEWVQSLAADCTLRAMRNSLHKIEKAGVAPQPPPFPLPGKKKKPH